MDIQALHQDLEQIKSEVPIISIPEETWRFALKKIAVEYFGAVEWPDLDTSITGIKADLKATSVDPSTQVIFAGYKQLKVINYKIEGRLRTDSPLPGFLSTFEILFHYVTFDVESIDGKLFLSRVDGIYDYNFDDTGNNRNAHLDFLLNQVRYTPEKLDSFVRKQEPFGGGFLANGFLENWNSKFELFDFSKIFNGIRLLGEFDISSLSTGTPVLNFVCLQPKYYEKRPISECEKTSIEEGIYTGSDVDIDNSGENFTTAKMTFVFGSIPNNYGVQPNPTSPTSDIFLYLPPQSTKELFSTDAKFPKLPISSSSGETTMFPFFLGYKLNTYVRDGAYGIWDKFNPTLKAEATLTMDLSFTVWVKILKVKTKICSLDTTSIYPIEYRTSAYEDFSGNINFKGVYYNEQRLETETANFDSILPDKVDKVVSKVARLIFEFVLRKAVTAILTAAGFPMASNQGGQYFDKNSGRTKTVVTKLSQYYANDDESASFGISFFERNVDR